MDRYGAYLGNLVGLISKRDIRYEGILDSVEAEISKVVLKNVRSLGREGRGNDIVAIPASKTVYGYIIFRDVDIKELNSKSIPRHDYLAKASVDVNYLTQRDSAAKKMPSKGAKDEVASPVPSSASWNSSIEAKMPFHTSGFLDDRRHLSTNFVTPSSFLWQGHTSWWACLPSFSTMTSIFVHPPTYLGCGMPYTSPNLHPGNISVFQCPGVCIPSMIPTEAQPPVYKQLNTLSLRGTGNIQKEDAFGQHLPSKKSVSSGRHTQQPEKLQHNMGAMTKGLLEDSKLEHPLPMQPLLPLPVPEAQHKRLIKEKRSSGRISSKGGHRGGERISRLGARGEKCDMQCSAVALSNPKLREDFDFEAMNKHFNKKEVWKEMKMKEQQALEDLGEGKASLDNTSRKEADYNKPPLYVENFFDLLSSEDLSCKENNLEQAGFARQLEIDTETFGSFPLTSYRCTRGCKKGGLCRGTMPSENDDDCRKRQDASAEDHL